MNPPDEEGVIAHVYGPLQREIQVPDAIVGHVGVAAGASTPDEAIEDVVRRIRSFEEPFVSDGPAFSRPGGSGTPSPPLA